jgi:hypothetical protein
VSLLRTANILVIVLTVSIAGDTITPIERKRKHYKTLEPDDTKSEESDNEPLESPVIQTLLENLEDY